MRSGLAASGRYCRPRAGGSSRRLRIRGARYLVGDGVADQVEPTAAAGRVDPALGHLPFRIRPEEDVAGPGRVVRRVWVRRICDLRCASVFEFDVLAIAAPGTGDQHQWATAAAPCSSISAPVVKRSSAKRAFRAWGCPCAIVWA